MPGMSGMDFLRALRDRAFAQRTKVVFCTTENGMAYIRAAIEAGADAYVMNPFDRKTLERKLKIVGLASYAARPPLHLDFRAIHTTPAPLTPSAFPHSSPVCLSP